MQTHKRQETQHTKQITHCKHIAHLAIAYCPKILPNIRNKYKTQLRKTLRFNGRSFRNAMTFWYLATWNFIHLNQVDFGLLLKFSKTVSRGEMLSNHMKCINEIWPL